MKHRGLPYYTRVTVHYLRKFIDSAHLYTPDRQSQNHLQSFAGPRPGSRPSQIDASTRDRMSPFGLGRRRESDVVIS